MERSIIHINVADFAVAVERVVDRRLYGRPVIIAPEGAARAAVYDMSDEAFRAGVRKGMLLSRARRICRDAAVLCPHPERYERAMADLSARALPFSPLVEPGPRDGHLFLDVTGTGRLLGPAVDVAWRLHRHVRRDLGLDPIWSVAPNKLTAKVASRLVKPTGEYVVGAGEEAALLSPLPLYLIPGIEAEDLRRLADFNLTRVFQVTAVGADPLETILGRRAASICNALQGIDDAPVLPAGQKPPRIVVDHAFGTDTNDTVVVEGILYRMVEETGRQLRLRGRASGRLALVLDHSDAVRRTRQKSLLPPSASDRVLFDTARQVLALAWTRRVRIRHLCMVCDRLVFPPAQQPLFPEPFDTRHERMLCALDRIRERFGTDAVRVGRTLAA